MNKEILFLENLYTLLESGYSVEESMNLCYEILNYPFILKMSKKLKEGYDLTSVLLNSRMPDVFKEYFSFYQNKNCLSESIEKSLNIYKTQKTFVQKMKSQLTYPFILIVFLLLFSIFVVFILLPQVNQLFISFQVRKSILIQVIFLLFRILPIFIIVVIVSLIMMIGHLLYGLQHKQHFVIEFYLRIPMIKTFLKKYFSLKFSIYYQELAVEGTDSASIIAILNQQMNQSDLKIVLYEMENRIHEGESIEEIMQDFDYFDMLFLTFFQMYLQNPKRHQSIAHYIDLTYQQIEFWISQFLKFLIPSIYGFVAVFVITIYISIVIPMMNIISDI